MITELDALTAVEKQLPDEGITFREFVTRACRLHGDHEETIEETVEEVLRLAEQDGIKPDTIVKMGKSGTKLN